MTVISQVAQAPINYGVRRQQTKTRRVGYRAQPSRTQQVKPEEDTRRKALEALRLRAQSGVGNTGMLAATTGLAQAGVAGLGAVAALSGQVSAKDLKKLTASGGSGKPGSLRAAVFGANNFRQLLTNLENHGIRATETGVRGFDQVDPGAHAAGGGHYVSPKKTADLNFGAPGASEAEKRKMAQLYKLMVAAGIPIKQYFHPGNDPVGHGDHGHLEVERRKW